MKAVILDMYGVILKDPEGGFMPFVNQTFPDLTRAEIYKHWDKADIGELTSLDLLRGIGFEGDDESFYEFARIIKRHYKLALISNDSSEWSCYLRDKYKINEYFDVITVSGDVRVKKPDPRIFELTLDKLGCSAADCIFVDDREFNLEAAKSLGMDAVLFNTRKVHYGGIIVNNFEELLSLLLFFQ